MEIEVVTTKRKLTASVLKQIPNLTFKEIRESYSNIIPLGWINYKGNPPAKYILCKFCDEYRQFIIYNFILEKSISDDSAHLVSKRYSIYFETAEEALAFKFSYDNLVRAGLQTQIYI